LADCRLRALELAYNTQQQRTGCSDKTNTISTTFIASKLESMIQRQYAKHVRVI